jgi:hypothetical protein
MVQSNATAIGIDRAYRFASKVPAFEISSSDPVDTATGVAVNKTITLTFSMPLHPPSVSNAKGEDKNKKRDDSSYDLLVITCLLAF